MTDFIHEAPPPENPKPAAPEKPTSEKERQKRVYAYIAVLFTVAFILILWSFLANHRSNQQVIDQLKGSTSMMQSTLEQNAKLEDEVKALETQVGDAAGCGSHFRCCECARCRAGVSCDAAAAYLLR